MKSFVVIGGSFFQRGLVYAARDAGYNVIVVDKNPNSHCFDLDCVHTINLSITDIPSVLNALDTFEVVGAATCQSDLGVELVGAINDKFKIVGPTHEQSRVLSSKYRFKKLCQSLGFSKGTFLKVSDDFLLEEVNVNSFPVAVKPIDSSGSRGVSRVDNSDELDGAIRHALRHSRSKKVLIEDWYDGLEFGCQVAVDSTGKLSILFHSDEVFNNIPVAHAMLTDDYPDVRNKLNLIVDKLNLRNCWMNVDLIQNRNTVNFLEIGLRLGATELDKLVNDITKQNVYETIVKSNYKFAVYNQPLKSFGVLFNPFETNFYLQNPDMFSKFLNEKGIYHKLETFDSIIPPFIDGTKRIGSFITSRKFSELLEIIQEAFIKYGKPI